MEQRHEIIHFSSKVPGKLFLHRLGSVPKHWHRSIELLFVLSGEVNIICDDHSFLLKETDLLLINAFSTHELYSDDAEMIAFQINLKNYPQFEEYGNCYFDFCTADSPNCESYDYMRHLLARLIKVNSSSENPLLSNSLISLTINELVSRYQTAKPEELVIRQKSIKQLSKITDYIDSNYTSGLTLNQIAEEFHFSTSYLSRFFKQCLNVTFSEYYNSVRLNHAVNELLSSSDTISLIAENNGFSDVRSMVSLFKKKYHMLPSEYRQMQPVIPSGKKTRNEVNYLAVSNTDTFSILAPYLSFTHFHLPETKVAIETCDIGRISTTATSPRLRHTWKKMCCVASARELLYGEVQDLIRKVQKDIHYRYIKFHGLTSDDMMLCDVLPDGRLHLSFAMIDKVFDFLMSVQLKPFMQFFIMPHELADNPKKCSFFTRQNTSLPAKMEQWSFLIRSLILHFIDKYGMAEVRTWPFAIWNEPDTTAEMFGFERKEDFFDFYKVTYDTIKSINPNFIVGSPSMLFLIEDPLHWYQPFFEYCHTHNCVPDALNIHFYDDDIELVSTATMKGQLKNKLSTDVNSFTKYLDDMYSLMSAYNMKQTPVFMTEWNLTVSHRNLINDTCFKACYLIKNLLENYDRLESFGYWSVTDFIGELQLSEHLFHGGLGMFTYNGIPKAHYHAFCMLTKLEDTFLGKGNGWFASLNKDTGKISLILYNYIHYNQVFASGELFDVTPSNRYTAFTDIHTKNMSVTFTDLAYTSYKIRETYVNRNIGSAYDVWCLMGGVESLSPEDYENLCTHSQPGIHLSYADATENSLTFQRSLEPHEVCLVEFIPR